MGDCKHEISELIGDGGVCKHCGEWHSLLLWYRLSLERVAEQGMSDLVQGLRERLDKIQALVNQQAEDEGLWFDAQTAPEAYLQLALRKLHAIIDALPEPLQRDRSI